MKIIQGLNTRHHSVSQTDRWTQCAIEIGLNQTDNAVQQPFTYWIINEGYNEIRS